MKFEIGAMSVGDILDRGLKILLTRFPTLYLISLITHAPLLIYILLTFPYLYADPNEPPSPGRLFAPLFIDLGLVVLLPILSSLANAAILRVIGHEFMNEHVSLGEAFQFAFHSFGKLFGATMIYTGLFVASMCGCCIPLIPLTVFYGLFAQVVVMEDLAGMKSLNRSKVLVQGFGWRIFFIYFFVFGIFVVLQNLMAGLLEYILPAHVHIQIPPLGISVPGPIANYGRFVLNNTTIFLVGLIVQAYTAVCTTLLYFDLRIRKEGYDLELAVRGQPAPEMNEAREPDLS
jgi:hypothetical protein